MNNKKLFLPKVSLIVVTYNNQETIEENIRSLLNQNYPIKLLEIIYIDSSTDKTTSILRKYDREICYYYQPRKGIPAARNLGIKKATGKVIAFTDADCFPKRDWLIKLVGYFTLSHSTVAVGGKLPNNKPANVLEKYIANITSNHQSHLSDHLPYLLTANVAFLRKIFDEVGFFDENLVSGEDADICWRIRKAGYELKYASEAEVYFKNRDTIKGLITQSFRDGRGWHMLDIKYGLSNRQLISTISGNAKKFLMPRNNILNKKNRYQISFLLRLIYYFCYQIPYFIGLLWPIPRGVKK